MLARTLRSTLLSPRIGCSRSFSSQLLRPPVTTLSSDEESVRDMVSKWAAAELAPHVRDMDTKCAMRPEIVKSLFDNLTSHSRGTFIKAKQHGPFALPCAFLLVFVS